MKALILVFSLFILVFSAKADVDVESVRLLSDEEMISLMGPFPAKGSYDEFQDFATMMKYQFKRTKADCEKAKSDEDVSIQNLFGAPKGPLTKSESRWATARLLLIMGESGANILKAKSLFKRQRPYIRNPLIIPCISKESSYAYPSGHTTLARYLALALSRIHPEKTEALMKRADEIALGRVIGGVHHPSDIEAGKKLADELARERLYSYEFELLLNQKLR
jgi:acid phosphatase (class A)